MNRIATLNYLSAKQKELNAKFSDKGSKEYKRAEVMLRAGHVTAEVQDAFTRMYRLAPQELSKPAAAEKSLTELYLTGFMGWSQDDLLNVVVNMHVAQALENLGG